MRHFVRLTVALAAIAVLTVGCTEDPVGFDEFGRGHDPLVTFTNRGAAQGSYGDYVSTGSGEFLVCGIDTSYEARIALQFYLSDSIVDSLDSLKVILYSKTAATDTLAGFTVHIITSAWSESQANWALANSFTRWIRPGGDFDTSAVASGRFGADSTVIDLFPVRAQIAGHAANGIIIVPAATGFSYFHSSYTSGKAPRLLVYQKGKNEQRLSATQDCYFVLANPAEVPGDELWVGSGYAYRSYLRFDLDSIPPLVRVTSAELVVGVTPLVAPDDTFTLAVYRLKEAWDGPFTDYDKSAVAVKQFTKADTTVVFDIRGLVQTWVESTGTNYGLLIRCSSEQNDIRRLAIVPVTDTALGPKLRGSYVRPPTPRYQ